MCCCQRVFGALDVACFDELLSASRHQHLARATVDQEGIRRHNMEARHQASGGIASHLPDVVLEQSQGPGPSAAAADATQEYCVVSGGSGFNDLVNTTPGATFVMPVS